MVFDKIIFKALIIACSFLLSNCKSDDEKNNTIEVSIKNVSSDTIRLHFIGQDVNNFDPKAFGPKFELLPHNVKTIMMEIEKNDDGRYILVFSRKEKLETIYFGCYSGEECAGKKFLLEVPTAIKTKVLH